jgi:hypothetical protein
VDFDAWIDRWAAEILWPALLGSLAVLVYLSVLARAHLRAKLLVALAHECRRRRVRQEQLRDTWGFGPRLDQARRLEQSALKLLVREGLAPRSVR